MTKKKRMKSKSYVFLNNSVTFKLSILNILKYSYANLHKKVFNMRKTYTGNKKPYTFTSKYQLNSYFENLTELQNF